MLKIILWRLGFYQKYEITYNSLISGDKNQVIDFYYYKNCPDWLLKEAALHWLKGRVLTCFSDIIYIERIGELIIEKQLIY